MMPPSLQGKASLTYMSLIMVRLYLKYHLCVRDYDKYRTSAGLSESIKCDIIICFESVKIVRMQTVIGIFGTGFEVHTIVYGTK